MYFMLRSFRALPFDSQNPFFFLFKIRKNLQASAFIILPLKWASRPLLELRIWTLTLLAFLLQWCQSSCSTDASGWTEGSLYWGNAKVKRALCLILNYLNMVWAVPSLYVLLVAMYVCWVCMELWGKGSCHSCSIHMLPQPYLIPISGCFSSCTSFALFIESDAPSHI